MKVRDLTRVARGGAGLAAVCAALAGAVPLSAMAQGTALDEITVTAQKGEESALDVRVDYIFNENTAQLDEFSVVDPNDYPGVYQDRKDLNARVAWSSKDDVWTAALWGKNLLDEKRLSGTSDISILFGTPFTSMGEPLTWGIELGYRF